DLVRGGGAYVELAPAGTRHRAARIGPGAGADQWGVADPAPALVGHAAGRGAGGQLAGAVQRDRANGTEVGMRRGRTRTGLATLARQRILQLLPALLGAEPGRVDQLDAALAGEGLGAFADQHHVR